MKILIGLVALVFCVHVAQCNLFSISPRVSQILQALGGFGLPTNLIGQSEISDSIADTQLPEDSDSDPTSSGNRNLYSSLCRRKCEDQNAVVCALKRGSCRQGTLGVFIQQMCPKTCGLCPRCPLSAKPCVPDGKCKDSFSGCFFMSRRCNAEGHIGAYTKQSCPVTCRICRPCTETAPRSLPTRCLRTCKDDHSDCVLYANSKGYCLDNSRYQSWMKKNCRKSCGLCKPCETRRPTETPNKPTLPPLPDELLALLESEGEDIVSPHDNTATSEPTTTESTANPADEFVIPSSSSPNSYNPNKMPENSMYQNQKPTGKKPGLIGVNPIGYKNPENMNQAGYNTQYPPTTKDTMDNTDDVMKGSYEQGMYPTNAQMPSKPMYPNHMPTPSSSSPNSYNPNKMPENSMYQNQKPTGKKPGLIGFSPIGYKNPENMNQAGYNTQYPPTTKDTMDNTDDVMKGSYEQGMYPTNTQMPSKPMYPNHISTDDMAKAEKPDRIGFSPIGYSSNLNGANSNSGPTINTHKEGRLQKPTEMFGSYQNKPMKPRPYLNKPDGQMYGRNPNKNPMRGSRRPDSGMMNNGPQYNHNKEGMTKPMKRPHRRPMPGKYLGRKPGYETKDEERCKMMMSDSDSMMDQCVNVHNYYRCLHGAAPLEFDSNLAASAQEYAERLAVEDVTMESLNAKTMEIGDDLNMIMMKTSDIMKHKMMERAEMMKELMEETDMSNEDMMSELEQMQREMIKDLMSAGTDMTPEDMMRELGMTNQQMMNQLRIIEESEMDQDTLMKQKKMMNGMDMMGEKGNMEEKDMMGKLEGKGMTMGETDMMMGEKDNMEEKDMMMGETDMMMGETDMMMGEKDNVEEKDMMMGETDMMEQYLMGEQNVAEEKNMMEEMEEKDMMGLNMMEGTDMMEGMVDDDMKEGENMMNGERSYRRNPGSQDMDIGVNVGISVNPSKKYGIRQAVIDWYAESLKYMYERTNKLMASKRFTQLVWKNTTKVGCGMQKMGDKMIVVAHYYNKGNMAGEYEENVGDMMEGCSNNCTMGSCLSIKGSSSACHCMNAAAATSAPVCTKRCVITCKKPSYFQGPWQYSCQGTKLCSCSHREDSTAGYMAGAWCK